MKRLILIATLLIAVVAMADWSTEVVESYYTNTAAAADTVGALGTNTATIYADFRILGPEFLIDVDGTNNTWSIVDFLPGDYGWQATPFRIINQGGVTLDLALTAVDPTDVTHTNGAYSSTAYSGAAFLDTYLLWAKIHNLDHAPSATDVADMTSTNNVDFETGTTANGWYDDPDNSGYMVPASGEYWHTTTNHLNLWATDAGTGSDDDQCHLYLGFQCPFAGWSHFDTQTVTMTVWGSLTTAAH